MCDREPFIHLLASALANSRWESAALLQRCVFVAGKSYGWFKPFVHRLLERFPGPARPRTAAIEAFIRVDAGFARVRMNLGEMYLPALPDAEMHSALPDRVEVPALCNVRQLAEWLGLRINELDAFANLRGFARRPTEERLAHYRYRVLAKRHGAVRLIESPKPRLKAIQRQILRRILDVVPTHDAAHGFRKGRSIATFAQSHVGKTVVARLDLADFFPCVTRARVAALFRTVGYPEIVAEFLAALCTTISPSSVWDDANLDVSSEQLRRPRQLYGVPHLPQGSPTSPAIANLCSYRLDCRLTGLARAAGASYTRYADDLAFSGDLEFARGVKRFLVHVAATVAEEGFVVHHRKTRIMRDGVRQHLAGVVVNRHLNVRRSDYDRLKAILVNCWRHGAASQNQNSHPDFRSHLRGRIAFVAQLHASHGERLREIFDRIAW
jgi:RNA-directed DNA polymerase